MQQTPSQPSNDANPTIYNRLVMGPVYKIWVHGISHPLAWGVSNPWLRWAYRTWTGPRHLCVGPGNGTWLRHVSDRTRTVELLDLNPQCLEMGADAVRAQGKEAVVHPPQDVAQPWEGVPEASLDSVDATMVLHCVRGESLHEKAGVFEQAHRALTSGGVFFGSTVLSGGQGVRPNAFARLLLRTYNGRSNTFANSGDTSDDLRAVLEKAGFTDIKMRVQGCTGVWMAVKP